MKFVGIVRNFDDLGRIVVPKELRKHFGFQNKTPVEIFSDDKGVFIRRYEPECIICGSIDDIKIFNNNRICKKCLEKLGKDSN